MASVLQLPFLNRKAELCSNRKGLREQFELWFLALRQSVGHAFQTSKDLAAAWPSVTFL